MTGGDLELAIRIAALADRQLMEGFRDPRLQSRTKSDGTPVTPVDAGVERMIRAELARGRPGDEVLGEEGEERPPAGSGRRWIVDPLDGTKNYLRGVPVFACLIALEAGGVLQLGVASAPALGLRWWAERGRGASRDDRAASSFA